MKQILCGSGFNWVQSGSGHVPPEAVCGGNQTDGEPLYVGRAHVGGSLVTGKILASHNCIYVPFDGIEHSIHEYEVLVARSRCKFNQFEIFFMVHWNVKTNHHFFLII